MKITTKNLADMYIMLKGMHPFNKWRLPPVKEVKFSVTDAADSLGTYVHDDDQHHITISRAKNGHLETVVKTMSHEMIHMLRGKTPKYGLHDAYFLAKSRAVALEMGFDPLEL
jgi:hypothetical protein